MIDMTDVWLKPYTEGLYQKNRQTMVWCDAPTARGYECSAVRVLGYTARGDVPLQRKACKEMNE